MEEQNLPERQLLKKLRDERKELEDLIAAIEKRLGIVHSDEDDEPERFAVVLRHDQFAGMSRPQAAIQLLKQVDRTLTTPQIFEFLKTGGADVSGKNSLNALYTALKRSPELRRVAPNTWALKEWKRYK